MDLIDAWRVPWADPRLTMSKRFLPHDLSNKLLVPNSFCKILLVNASANLVKVPVVPTLLVTTATLSS
jgi:hypothetical protein